MTITSTVFAQVGIGTITPHGSSVLDVSSTTQGILTPRMTTVQRTAIVAPADGLMVYDTDLKSFYHYNSSLTAWSVINSGSAGRSNFKRIKSTDVLAKVLADELSAGGGSKYLLNTSTLYEINGTVVFNFPIELNNAYVVGLDSGEDKLVKVNGDLFTGTSGGSVKVLTLVASGNGGNVFNITGNGTASLILGACIVANSANVGLVKGFSSVFVSNVQFVGNRNGIIYETIGKLLINNAGWVGGALPLGNSGTYEKIVGTFEQVAKQGGFSEVSGSSIGFDVSLNPTISGDAVLEAVVFTGTNTTSYVKPYTTGTYPGYNFNGLWTVRSTGIADEGDSFATGNLYLDRSTISPTATFPNANTAYKVPGTTVSTNLYRMKNPVNNRLVYLGKKSRSVSVTASISCDIAGTGDTDYLFFFVKYSASGEATIIKSSETYINSSSGFVQSFPVTGSIQVNSGDYIELHASRLTGTNKTITFRSYNMSIK